MRIASLLPSATEIVYALGLGEQLVAVTHECDYPEEARRMPAVTRSLVAAGLPSAEIDRAVSNGLRDAHTIYDLDGARLRELSPDVVLTQNLCEVCAVPEAMVQEAVCTMPAQATVVSLDPMNLEGVFACVSQAGEALGVRERAEAVVKGLRDRVRTVELAVHGVERPSVLAAEWLDPVYAGGHWVPELIALARGRDPVGGVGQPSHPIPWDEVLELDPEIILLMPCGFTAEETAQRYSEIASHPGWSELRAVRDGRVYALNATAYFSRPGPRLVDGLEVLAGIFHPDRFRKASPAGAVIRLTR